MTDSEKQASDEHGDEAEAPEFSFSNEDFDFADVGISETEYYDALATIKDLPFADEVGHSLFMNEIAVAIDPGYSGTVPDAEIPDSVAIRCISQWASDDEDDDRLCVEFRTTRLLCSDEKEDEMFHGECDPEAMAALAVELRLFDEVESAEVISTEGEHLVAVVLDETIESTYLFDLLQTFMGYDIRTANLTEDGVTRLVFGFSEERAWSHESYQKLQQTKANDYRNAMLDSAPAERLPCGHESEPTIAMVSHLHTADVAVFPTVMVAGDACHKVPVEDGDSAVLEVAEWPDGVSPESDDNGFVATAISRGYACAECDVFYPFVDAGAAGADRTPAGSIREMTVTETIDGVEYEFETLPIAARPVGYRDGYSMEL